MSKLPDDLKWSEEVLALLAETDKTSCKSVCIAFGKAAEAKDTKAAAMTGVKELCDWAKEQKVIAANRANNERLARAEAREQDQKMAALLDAKSPWRCNVCQKMVPRSKVMARKLNAPEAFFLLRLSQSPRGVCMTKVDPLLRTGHLRCVSTRATTQGARAKA